MFGAVAAHIPAAADPPDAGGADEAAGAGDAADAGSTPARRASEGPFGSAASIDALLGEAGFDTVQHVEEDHELVLRSPDQWIEWSWSHGARQLWESVPESQQAAARADAAAALAELSEPDGSLHHRWTLRYSLATPSPTTPASPAT